LVPLVIGTSVHDPPAPLKLIVGALEVSVKTSSAITITLPTLTPAGIVIATDAAVTALAVAPVLKLIAMCRP
jgi:hypothetical protein